MELVGCGMWAGTLYLILIDGVIDVVIDWGIDWGIDERIGHSKVEVQVMMLLRI